MSAFLALLASVVLGWVTAWWTTRGITVKADAEVDYYGNPYDVGPWR